MTINGRDRVSCYLILTVRNNGSYQRFPRVSPHVAFNFGVQLRVKNSCSCCWRINSNPVQERYAAVLVMCWLPTTIYVLGAGIDFAYLRNTYFWTRCIEALFSGSESPVWNGSHGQIHCIHKVGLGSRLEEEAGPFVLEILIFVRTFCGCNQWLEN